VGGFVAQKVFLWAFLCLAFLAFGCRARSETDENTIRTALERVLIYVGDAPDRSATEVGDHGSERLDFPDRFVRGRQYIFHRKSTPEASWVMIEKALRSHGAEIIDAPRGNVGLLFAYVGGPFFVIEFRMGKLHCSIQNHVAREVMSGILGPEMQQEDFILRVR
jgi:hypothetical protein